MFENRKIYSFHDGKSTVYVDPLEVLREVRFHAGADPDTLAAAASKMYPKSPGVRVSDAEFAEGREAERKLIAAVRHAMQLPALDRSTGEGLTSEQVKDVWNSFCASMSEKKNPPSNSPTSATLSPAPPSPSITPSSSGSC